MLKKLLSLLVFTAAITLTITAQQKTGYINSLKVIQAMPEYIRLTDSVEALKRKDQNILQYLYTEYEKLQKNLQSENPSKTTPDPVMQDQIERLQQLQNKIQMSEEDMKNELDSIQQTGMKPINDKYLKAVQDVAHTEKYNSVLDINSAAVVFFEDTEHEITALVISKLGIATKR